MNTGSRTRNAGDFGEGKHCGQGVARQMSISDGTTEDDSSEMLYTDEQIARGRETYADAMEWREANAGAWRYIVHRYTEIGESGRRIGVQRILEEVRARGELAFTDARDIPFSVNNSHAPVFARMLCREHPLYASRVEKRRSVQDVIMTS